MQAAATADCSRGLGASPKPNRLIVEACCHPQSKLSQPREESEGCHILQFTERSDLLDASVRREIANQVNEFDGDVLVWVSIPCTGARLGQHEASDCRLESETSCQSFSSVVGCLPKVFDVDQETHVHCN